MTIPNRLFILAAIVVVFIGLNFPFDHRETESTRTQFDTKYVDNNQIELGSQTVTTQGSKGTTDITYEYKASILGWLFDRNGQRGQGKISAEVIVEPVTEEVQKGTLKYQYMWCSDGTSRYYTNEQFANPLTGFISSSPDYCSQSGHGYKLKLASAQGPRCRDVTTYDYNWNNDMLCTNADGSTFYTSYGGASAFLGN